MPSLRPILDTWRASPLVATTLIDPTKSSPGTPIPQLLDAQVSIGLRGDGPISSRELVPLTRAATELLNGPHRDSARSVLRGVLGTLDAVKGANDLRGFSFSNDMGAFVTQSLISNIEAGLHPDSVKANDAAGFEKSMVELAAGSAGTKAQNLGWMDLGPSITAKTFGLIERPPRVANDDAKDVALTFLHELEHNVTPFNVHTTAKQHYWLEEGLAESLAWWPGRAADLLTKLGTPLAKGDVVDPWSIPDENQASSAYRGRHQAIMGLLGLAGVAPTRDDGSTDPSALARARQLLQGEDLAQVPRNLARAIVRNLDVDPDLTDVVSDLVVDVQGDPKQVRALSELLTSRGRTTG